MRRREFMTLLGGAAVAWPLAARAQQVGKFSRISRPAALSNPARALGTGGDRGAGATFGLAE